MVVVGFGALWGKRRNRFWWAFSEQMTCFRLLWAVLFLGSNTGGRGGEKHSDLVEAIALSYAVLAGSRQERAGKLRAAGEIGTFG